MKMNILFITTKLHIGGVQTFLMNYIPILVHNGISVSIAVQTHDKQPLDDYFLDLGCRIFHITSVMESRKKYQKDICSILKVNPQINAVYDNQNFLNIFSLLTARKCGIKIRISHSHSSYKTNRIKRKIQRMIFKLFLPFFATHCIACSEVSAKWLYGNRKVFILPNAIDESKYRFNPSVRESIRQKMGIEDKKVFIHVGAFSDAKNHDFLLDVFAAYLKENDNATLILCGDGPKREDILNKIKKLSIENNVVLLGAVNNPYDFLNAADIFLFPSKYEGQGIAVIEAQTSGISIVCSNAVSENTKFMENMFICKNFEVESWIEMINKIEGLSIDRTYGAIKIKNTAFSLIETENLFLEYIKSINVKKRIANTTRS